ncbi:AP2 domain protein [Planctomycetes bacterium CA13]|uniref:AP2 domain protein n=1 Tax=Novipirellula herctigrandis TaxID=2527986 RepID=A0A5C5YN23_9BACT|nr:AP2 domain protein [Planctomycetes bacterium CA13]
MSANRNITRIDRDNSGGFLVRVMRKGKKTSKFFSDSENGGKRKALIAAKAFRDELETKMKGYSAKELSKIMRSNNTSGVVGVRLVEEVDTRWPSQPTYLYWVAQWSPEKGVRRTKRFSVEKYGDEKAYELAVKARKRGVAAMKS